jgi:hypothetical protein
VSSLYVQQCRVVQRKTQNYNHFLLLFISSYCYFKNSENVGARSYLVYWGRHTCGILSLWVILEVLIAVCVRRAVVLVVTPCRLIEFYHPFFFYHAVRCGRVLHLYGGNRDSGFLQNICKFLPLHIPKVEIIEELGNCVTDVQRHVQGGWNMTGTSAAFLNTNQSRSYLNHLVPCSTFNEWMGQCGHINPSTTEGI